MITVLTYFPISFIFTLFFSALCFACCSVSLCTAFLQFHTAHFSFHIQKSVEQKRAVWKMVIMVIIKSIYMVYTILLLQALWNSGNRNWNHKGAVEMRLKILLREYIDILPSALAFAIIFRILSHFVSCDLYCESQMYYWMLCHKLLYRIFCDQGTASQIPLFKAWIIITIIFFFFYFFTYGFLSYITGYKLIRLTDFA